MQVKLHQFQPKQFAPVRRLATVFKLVALDLRRYRGVYRKKTKLRQGVPRFARFRFGVARKGQMKVKEANRIVGSIGGDVSNGAKESIDTEIPYVVEITIQGTADLLFHKWDCAAVKEKADSKKGSKAKKEDNLESYVYRMEDGTLGLPGEYLRMSIIGAAKYRQDPRSPRKSAMDIFKAAIISLTPIASLGQKQWDYEDRRRVTIQRSAITRVRPAFKAGWKAKIQLQNNLPEYISPSFLNEVTQQSGKLIGVGDFRPTFGRFQVIGFELIDLN